MFVFLGLWLLVFDFALGLVSLIHTRFQPGVRARWGLQPF